MKNKKTPKANLESKKDFFFQIGLIVSLLIVLAAFEWRFYEKEINFLDNPIKIDFDEESIINTKPDQPEPEIPKPKNIDLIIVDNDVDQSDFNLDIEFDDYKQFDFTPFVFEKEDDKPNVSDEPFIIVEDMPEFIGGESALYEYLGDNLKYPRMAVEAGIQGTVYVRFVVEKDGTISSVQLLRGIGGGCDEEAIKVVRNMPRWNPGKQRGMPVRVQMNLPVKFSLGSK